jgi:hypothetical protein
MKNRAMRILIPLMTTMAVTSIFIGLVFVPLYFVASFWGRAIPMILFVGGGSGYFLARRHYLHPKGMPPKIPRFVPDNK